MKKPIIKKSSNRILTRNYKISSIELHKMEAPANLTIGNSQSILWLRDLGNDLNSWKENALSLFINYNSAENEKEWQTTFAELNEYFGSIIHLLETTLDKTREVIKSDHTALWNALESRINNIQRTIKKLVKISDDQMTEKDGMYFVQDVKHFDSIILPFITLFIGICKTELQ